MKNIILYICFCLLLSGCVTDQPILSIPSFSVKYKLSFNPQIKDYDDATREDGINTRGSNSLKLTNGDRIYLFFSSENNFIPGIATYNEAEDEWDLELNQELDYIDNGEVRAYYFKKEEKIRDSNIELSAFDPIYFDITGEYKYTTDNEMHVGVNFVPLNGRVRFKGQPGEIVNIEGVNSFNQFNILTAEFKAKQAPVQLTVLDNGYTDYLYGFMPEGKKTIKIDINNESFASSVPDSFLEAGKSGWLNLPYVENHEGWTFFTMEEYEDIPSIPTKLFLKIDSREGWNISTKYNSSWILFDKKQGIGDAQIEINIQDNSSISNREDYIIVESESGLQNEYKITQLSKYLNISLDSLKIDYNCRISDDIVIDTDGNFTLKSNVSWLTFLDQTDNSFKFKVEDNLTDEERTAEIKIKLILETGNLEKSISILQAEDGYGYRNDHKFVDLGLPSGCKWALTNLGANECYEIGSGFAWGETKTKSSFTWDNYAYGYRTPGDETYLYHTYITKYNEKDYQVRLQANDDAAYVNIGEKWRIPTPEEWTELIKNCQWSKETIGSSAIMKVVGPNGKYIVIPYRNLSNGDYTAYWTNTVSTSDKTKANDAYFWDFLGNFTMSESSRERGLRIRAVTK